MKRRVSIWAFLAAAVLTVGAPRAEAVPVELTPGSNTALVPIDAPPVGPRLAELVNQTMVAEEWSATYTTAVYRDATNFFCANCLTFLYQVTHTGQGSDNVPPTAIDLVTAFSFRNFRTAVSQFTGPYDIFAAGTEDSDAASRDASGSTISFFFQPPPDEDINPGETTYILMIDTNATEWDPGRISVSNGGTVTDDAFEPGIARVPEPASLILLALGFLGTGIVARRRGKN